MSSSVNDSAAATERVKTPLEQVVAFVLTVLSYLSLAQLKALSRRKNPSSHGFMEIYVVAWFAVLNVLLWNSLGPKWLVLAVVSYRLVDIVSYRLLFLFVKSESRPWDRAIIRRSVIIVLLNFFEALAGFAVLYVRTGSVGSGTPPVPISTATEALYYSFVTMTTVGYGDIVPISSTGRWIVMAQLCTMIVFVIFLLPALMSVFAPALSRKE